MIRRLLASPALHCAVLGAVLFAGDSLRRSAAEQSSDRVDGGRIEVPLARVEAAQEDFVILHGREPDEADLARIVERLVDEEVLYRHALDMGLTADPVVQRRLAQIATFVAADPHETKSEANRAEEALELGLHEGDQVVRRVLIDGARRLIRAGVLIHEPTEEALASYLAAHPERFSPPAEVRLSHVLLRAEERPSVEADAAALLARLRSEAVPPEKAGELGDPSLIPPSLPALPDRELERRFGHRFVVGLAGLPVGSWQGPVPSRDGLHLVFLHERVDSAPPALAEVREEVREVVRQELADRWLKTRVAELREGIEVVVGSPLVEAP